MMEYLTLFASSLLSATIIPFSSEAALLYLLSSGADTTLLLISAGSGNSLGSIINYIVGKKGVDYLIRSERLSPVSMEKAEDRFAKWGGWSLLLSWLPIVGDPLTFIAGALHYPLLRFVSIVTFAKFSRYWILIYLSQ